MDVDGIISDFLERFEIVAAREESLLHETYRIRYEVYTKELGWEPVSATGECRETDGFDSRAVACLLKYLPVARFIGSVRVIVAAPGDPNAPFPFELALQNHLGLEPRFPPGFNRAESGEISRMAVVSAFRRRGRERDHPATDLDPPPPGMVPETRQFAHITLGLYLGAACMALERGLSSVVATMEPRLARRLRSYGFHFEQCSAPFEHRGTRAIYVMQRDAFFEHASDVVSRLIGEISRQLRKPFSR